MVVMGVVWTLAWLLLGAAGLVPGTAIAATGMLVFMGVFAFGETLMQPTIPAISNDLAADHTRGRYNAINAAAFQGGAILGPVVAGVLLDRDLAGVYVGLMIVGCLCVCVMARMLERRISPTVNGVTVDEPLETAAADRS